MRFDFFVERLDTPVGEMIVVTDGEGNLRAVDWHDYEAVMHDLLRRQYPKTELSISQARGPSTATEVLHRYFEGDIFAIDRIRVAMGGTPFQRRVWDELRMIPAGETITYTTLAQRVGQPTAVRAAGRANGSNVIDVVVPCHRVVGMNASLTGYGGGIHRKKWLLEHEAYWRTKLV